MKIYSKQDIFSNEVKLYVQRVNGQSIGTTIKKADPDACPEILEDLYPVSDILYVAYEITFCTQHHKPDWPDRLLLMTDADLQEWRHGPFCEWNQFLPDQAACRKSGVEVYLTKGHAHEAHKSFLFCEKHYSVAALIMTAFSPERFGL